MSACGEIVNSSRYLCGHAALSVSACTLDLDCFEYREHSLRGCIGAFAVEGSEAKNDSSVLTSPFALMLCAVNCIVDSTGESRVCERFPRMYQLPAHAALSASACDSKLTAFFHQEYGIDTHVALSVSACGNID